MGKEAKITRRIFLKDKLDEIDERVGKKAFDGFYSACLAKKMGMWNKGEAIDVTFRGAKVTFVQLAEETGRSRQHLKKWYELYLEYPDKGDYYLVAQDEAKEWAQKALVPSLVSKLTGNAENYTPVHIIDNVRDVLGEIDLDPASCKMAQKVVGAKKYYTKETNGLDKSWYGRVFLNPPYGMPDIRNFTDKLIESLPDIEAAILLTNDQTDTDWWQKCAANANVVFMPDGRLSFYTPDKEKTSPTNGQTFFYYGDNEEKFKRNFQWGLLMKVV